MSSITIEKTDLTKMTVDCIVNAANSHLAMGGGVCGAIFRAAGPRELQSACDRIGYCPTGGAVITPEFALNAKNVIHAVGPVWRGGNNHEPEDLYGCYRESLDLAYGNDIHSIGFPLISSGIFGYPKDLAWREALQSCNDWVTKHPDYDIKIVFAVLDDKVLDLGLQTMKDLGITNNEPDHDEFNRDRISWFKKYIPILQMIDDDEELKTACKEYSAYSRNTNAHNSVTSYLYRYFMHEAYDNNIVIKNYGEIVKKCGSDKEVSRPTQEFLDRLTAEQILACIAWHFRRDHFVEGSLVNDSIAGGHMLFMMKSYMNKINSRA